jgi:hypothetical protein
MSDRIFISFECLYDQNMAGFPPLQVRASTTKVICRPGSRCKV